MFDNEFQRQSKNVDSVSSSEKRLLKGSRAKNSKIFKFWSSMTDRYRIPGNASIKLCSFSRYRQYVWTQSKSFILTFEVETEDNNTIDVEGLDWSLKFKFEVWSWRLKLKSEVEINN